MKFAYSIWQTYGRWFNYDVNGLLDDGDDYHLNKQTLEVSAGSSRYFESGLFEIERLRINFNLVEYTVVLATMVCFKFDRGVVRALRSKDVSDYENVKFVLGRIKERGHVVYFKEPKD